MGDWGYIARNGNLARADYKTRRDEQEMNVVLLSDSVTLCVRRLIKHRILLHIQGGKSVQMSHLAFRKDAVCEKWKCVTSWVGIWILIQTKCSIYHLCARLCHPRRQHGFLMHSIKRNYSLSDIMVYYITVYSILFYYCIIIYCIILSKKH